MLVCPPPHTASAPPMNTSTVRQHSKIAQFQAINRFYLKPRVSLLAAPKAVEHYYTDCLPH